MTEKKINTDEILSEIKKQQVTSPSKVIWKRLKRNKLAIVGLYIIVFMVLVAVLGPVFSRYKMESIDLNNVSASPTGQHLLGTDEVGRDVLTRLMYAGRISLTVGLAATAIAIVIGSILGGLAGFYGGVVDNIIMRLVDVFMCFPFLPLLIMMAAILTDLGIPPDKKLYFVMFIIGFLSWPGLCRMVRGQILSLREQEFMQAAEALGLKDRRKIFKHLIPNTFATIIVTATMEIAGAIITESILSFLGMGVVPPTPSWGQMISVAEDLYVLQYQPWLWIAPGLCIFLTVMSINLFGDGLRDAFDPKLKR